ncbi:MAG: hypothetical protein JRI97_07610, partial [Deltaproteobacteria bacterium]|nr:hypothetical protein [Deltaproteobacteria bacterium]
MKNLVEGNLSNILARIIHESAAWKGSRDRLQEALCALALAAAVCAAWANSLDAALVLDDLHNIRGNPHIQHLWPPDALFCAPDPSSLGGRPVGHFSFALSHALSGGALWGHHAFNLAVHLAAVLLVFALFLRVLSGPGRMEKRPALFTAFAGAAVFGLHPVQTEAVTYLTQRLESMAAML